MAQLGTQRSGRVTGAGANGMPGSPKSSPPPPQLDRINHAITQICRVLRVVIICGTFGWGLYLLVPLATQASALNGNQSVAAKTPVSSFAIACWLVFTLFGLCGIYIVAKERRIRSRESEALRSQIHMMQTRVDKEKAPSGLGGND